MDPTLSDTLKAIWGELQTQMTNMSKRVKPLESSRNKTPKDQ